MSQSIIGEVLVKYPIRLKINGETYEANIKSNTTLLELLRDEFGLTGTKRGCDTGQCGACTVLLNGKPVNSCLVLALDAGGKEVITIEGLAVNGRLHPLQEAFIQEGAVQCGYCTSGMILSAKALLDESPAPTEEEVKRAIEGNLCRCTGYNRIVQAVLKTAEKMGG